MNGRDLAIVGAVVLVAGFAIADAMRRGEPARPEAGVERPLEGPDAGELAPIRAAVGSLVFTDADDCRLRELAFPSGRELPHPTLTGTCELWGPSAGTRVAYALGSVGDIVVFRFADLNHPDEDLGTHRALSGLIAWDPDGQRAAWCTSARSGVEVEFYRERRKLADCPRAYTADGKVAYVRGDAVVAEGGAVFRAPGLVLQVGSGRDGSLAVVTERGRVEVWRRDGTRTGVDLPPHLRGERALFSPDNCAALFLLPGQELELRDLGCFRGESPRTFTGVSAAWSPDGELIAVAEWDRIAFYRAHGDEVVRWPVAAAALVWRD